jgi:hypothetical protein
MPPIGSWRVSLAWWPIPLRRKWGEVTANYEKAGLKWYEAEWKAFSYLVDHINRYQKEHPENPIPFQAPFETPFPSLEQVDLYSCNISQKELDDFARDRERQAAQAMLARRAFEQQQAAMLSRIEQEKLVTAPKQKKVRRRKKSKWHNPNVREMF